jgi:hypothetical protein
MAQYLNDLMASTTLQPDAKPGSGNQHAAGRVETEGSSSRKTDPDAHCFLIKKSFTPSKRNNGGKQSDRNRYFQTIFNSQAELARPINTGSPDQDGPWAVASLPFEALASPAVLTVSSLEMVGLTQTAFVEGAED